MITFEALNLPVVLAKPDSDEGWIRTRQAKWNDLAASVRQRYQNADRVTDEAVQFDRAVETLRPLMEARPDLTVAEALLVLSKVGAP